MAKLTVKEIEAAKPESRSYKLMDGHGLQLRVAPDGTKTWLVRYMVDGKERQYRLPKPYRAKGGEGYFTLQEARDEAAKIRALARQDIDYPIQQEEERQAHERRKAEEAKAAAAEMERQRSESLTIKDLFDAWLKEGVRRKDGNKELLRSFASDVLPEIGQIEVRHLTEHDVHRVLRKMVERGANRLAVLAFGNLRQMLGWAEQRKPWRKLLAEGKPTDLIDIKNIVSDDYNINNRRKRVLRLDEIRELYTKFAAMRNAYADAPDRRVANRPVDETTEIAIWIMLSTLCRVGELSMTRWEHVDFETHEWRIPLENTKGQRDERNDFLVFMSDFTLRQFKRLHKLTGHTEWCFPASNKEKGHVCVKSISKQVGDRQTMFKKDRHGNPRKPMKNRSRNENALVLADGKYGGWTPHDLRRTGATMMQGLGVKLDIIDRCQNHVLGGSKVRRHYMLHEYADEKRDAWQRLGERLDLLIRSDSENVIPFPSATYG